LLRLPFELRFKAFLSLSISLGLFFPFLLRFGCLCLRFGGSGFSAGSTRAANATSIFSISSSQAVICSW
jgi:hypothetical protein